MTIAVRKRGIWTGLGAGLDKLNNQLTIGFFLTYKKMISTPFFYVNLQEFVQIFDDIVIPNQLNHINSLHDDSKSIIFLKFYIKKKIYLRIM